MRKIQFICDKCLQIIGFQIMVYKETEETHLYPVGNQNWCGKCLMTIEDNPLNFPDKFKVLTKEEFEQYVKKV